jgi:hypothetical protein
MSCCGGPSRVGAAPLLRAAIRMEAPVAENKVRMQFTGKQAGAMFWTVDGVTYRGGANATDRYADVDKDHVKQLEATGVWQKVEAPKAQTPKTETKAETKADAKAETKDDGKK